MIDHPRPRVKCATIPLGTASVSPPLAAGCCPTHYRVSKISNRPATVFVSESQ